MAVSLYIFNFKEMVIKKLFFNIILVVTVVIILDFAIGRTLRYFYFKETSGVHFCTTYSMETTKEEGLVFGSSRAIHHYVPKVFEDSLNISFYNTGRDGNGIFYQTALLKSVLKRYTPKAIIFDYDGDLMNEKIAYDRLSSLLPYYRTHEEIRSIVELKSKFERIKLLSEIYPFNSQILTIVMGNLEVNKLRNPDNKGYVALYKEWQTKIDTTRAFLSADVDQNKLSAFRESLNLGKRSGAAFFVVYSPVFHNYKIQEMGIIHDACSYENIPFWNYTRDTLFLNNNKLFNDVLHLNNNGAEIFSKLVVEKIKREKTIKGPL